MSYIEHQGRQYCANKLNYGWKKYYEDTSIISVLFDDMIDGADERLVFNCNYREKTDK